MGSPYEGGIFFLYLKVPFSFPFDPPEVFRQRAPGGDPYLGEVVYTDGSTTSAPVVPEPGSMLMLALGGGIAFLRRRFRKTKTEE